MLKEGFMYYLQFALKVLIVFFLIIAITRIYMEIAAFIGKQFGFGKFFTNLLQKIRKKNKS